MFTKEIEHRINTIDAEIARHTTKLFELNTERTRLLIGIEVIKDYETKKDMGIKQDNPIKKRSYNKKQNKKNIELPIEVTPISPNHDNHNIQNNISTKRNLGLTQTIVKILDSTKHGFSSHVLLEKINKELGQEIGHKTFYPTMSRLFKTNRVGRSERTKKWKLAGAV